jgi:uncharacterized protein
MITLGVLSDTHIPDRTRHLHPDIVPLFRDAGVQAILHAGDVCTPGVLRQLHDVAPVYAVRGNRDWLLLRDLPLERILEFQGIKIALTHGHGRWWNYLADRVAIAMHGVQISFFRPRLQIAFPDADVIVFGHIHRSLNQWVNGQLIFNPGSPHFPDTPEYKPSVGLLYLEEGMRVRGEIVALSEEAKK